MDDDIVIYDKPPANGNPNGVLDGPKGSLFFKKGTFYKINYSGSNSPDWKDLYFQPYNIPSYFLIAKYYSRITSFSSLESIGAYGLTFSYVSSTLF